MNQIISHIFCFVAVLACAVQLLPASEAAPHYQPPPGSVCNVLTCPPGTNCSMDENNNAVCNPVCVDVSCPAGKDCSVDENKNIICTCNSKPVCGSDGKTYSGECALEEEARKTSTNIVFLYVGECNNEVNPCEGFSCLIGKMCAVDESHMPICVCSTRLCPIYGTIVCGSDGRTYDNDCDLQKESCISNSSTTVAYEGYCLEGSVCSGYQCPPDETCQVDEYNRPVCACIQYCSDLYNPICGSDGKTYRNLCQLKSATCKAGTNVTVAYAGQCFADQPCRLQCSQPTTCIVDAEQRQSCGCKNECNDNYSPVCGSDGKTYDNFCQLAYYACKTNSDLEVYFYGDGVCSEGSKCKRIYMYCPLGQHCDSEHQTEPKCVCDKVCPKTYKPICGRNNKTYNNPCELQRDSCVTNTTIQKQFDGRCEDGPGCNQVNCGLNRNCVVDERNRPRCVCTQNCYVDHRRVCGTDNKTYSSECFLRVAACLTNTTIAVQRYERCGEGAEN